MGERQRKLNAVRAKADKMRDVRNSPAGNGAGMMAAGVTTGATLMAPIRAYSESENAANQLAGSMMGPGGKVAPEFAKLNKLAIATGDRLPGTTADFQNMMTMLRRQGMSAQVIPAGWGVGGVSRRAAANGTDGCGRVCRETAGRHADH